MQNIGKIIVIAGIILVVAGIIIWLLGDKLNWLGNLPGDIKIKRDNFSFYMPLASMILISLVVSLIIWLIRKFLG
jgi:H+/Cl- antiporter ClcA